MTPSAFTYLYLTFFALMLAFQTWLSLRNLRFVQKHRGEVPAEFRARIELADHQKAADYTAAKVRLSLWESAIDAVVLLVFTLGGGLFAIDALMGRELGDGYLRGLGTVFGLMLVSSLVAAPFNLYRTFGIEAKYGFNKMTLSLYLLDTIKGIALALVIGVPLLLVTFWLMQKMGDAWWLYVWLVWLGFSLAMMVIFPNFIAPWFNKFSPLADVALKQRIE
ncbi:MAG: M48 family peptidase, partial [Betaproteobacteria bacterium]|nr:M48 family peptidase [Betaproteobacteria bacterium]